MAFENLVQKAFYLGVGLASYAGEKAGVKIGEWSVQAQQAIEDLVARGEITTEDARRMVESLINQQADADSAATPPQEDRDRSPRPIEILSDAEDPPSSATVGDPEIVRLRQEAQALQERLQNLRNSQDH